MVTVVGLSAGLWKLKMFEWAYAKNNRVWKKRITPKAPSEGGYSRYVRTCAVDILYCLLFVSPLFCSAFFSLVFPPISTHLLSLLFSLFSSFLKLVFFVFSSFSFFFSLFLPYCLTVSPQSFLCIVCGAEELYCTMRVTTK